MSERIRVVYAQRELALSKFPYPDGKLKSMLQERKKSACRSGVRFSD